MERIFFLHHHWNIIMHTKIALSSFIREPQFADTFYNIIANLFQDLIETWKYISPGKDNYHHVLFKRVINIKHSNRGPQRNLHRISVYHTKQANSGQMTNA